MLHARALMWRLLARPRVLVASVAVLLLVAAAALDVPGRLGNLAPESEPRVTPSARPTTAPTPRPATLSNLIRDDNAQLDRCTPDTTELARCGTAPKLRDGAWLNTPGGRAVSLDDLRGKVVLVDFFSASCANCRRDSRYVRAWEDRYRDVGLEVVGVHVPEFDFEKDRDALATRLDDLSVRFPVLMDNVKSTLTRYRSQVLPSKYLVDRSGQVRAISFGEGKQARFEGQIRQALTQISEDAELPRPVGALRDGEDPAPGTTQQINLGDSRGARYDTESDNPVGDDTRFRLPDQQPDGTFSLGGLWRLEPQRAVPRVGAVARVTFRARAAFQLVGGTGTLEVTTSDGESRTARVNGPADLVQVYASTTASPETLTVRYSGDLQVYAFSFG